MIYSAQNANNKLLTMLKVSNSKTSCCMLSWLIIIFPVIRNRFCIHIRQRQLIKFILLRLSQMKAELETVLERYK
jgi:hypothetical protein